ncbi:hypothetical protein [Streptomyces sp. NPDC058622]|uniref:hypothetical protein n=1 Tax=Streptomyces sp. NPDC058622 TaxID=3346562 RepID=UPI00364F4E26
MPVTMARDDPRPPQAAVEAKHRRPRTYSLLVTGGMEQRADGKRVWEPSREHGFHALRHFCASEQLGGR